MNFAVIVFPGSNCDHDAYHIFKEVLNASTSPAASIITSENSPLLISDYHSI